MSIKTLKPRDGDKVQKVASQMEIDMKCEQDQSIVTRFPLKLCKIP